MAPDKLKEEVKQFDATVDRNKTKSTSSPFGRYNQHDTQPGAQGNTSIERLNLQQQILDQYSNQMQQ